MKKTILLLFIFPAPFFGGFFSFAKAQTDKKKFAEAEGYFSDSNFTKALPIFLDLLRSDTANANLNYRVGVCYLNSGSEKTKSLSYLQKAVKDVSEKSAGSSKEKQAPVEAYWALARSQALNYDFSMAINSYDRFLSYLDESATSDIAQLKHEQEYCYNGIELMKKPVKFKIVNLGNSVNTSHADYAPMISADEELLAFTSRRPENIGGLIDPENNDFFEDIYITSKADSTWKPAQNIGPQINSAGHEGTIGIAANGQTILIYKDDNGDGNIYSTTLTGDVWSKPVKLPESINSKNWEPSATLNSDGTMIYFVSDRKGGFGGRDIYRVVKLPSGEWSGAMNLGPTINTPYDEEGPFIHPDGVTLFFSSAGHKSMGGFDIFYSSLNDDNKWNEPINVGYPINTPDDDLYYTLSADGMHAYYSTVKPDGMGDKDIYMVSYDTTVVDPIVLLKGLITTDEGSKFPADVKITITDEATGIILQEISPNSSTGKYLAALNPGKNKKVYLLNFQAPGYKPVSERIDISADNSYQVIEEAIDMKKVNLNKMEAEKISLDGMITDQLSGAVLKGHIVVTNLITNKVVCDTTSNDQNGFYNIPLEKGKNYSVLYEASGYLFRTENVHIPKDNTQSELKKDVGLGKIMLGAKIVLKNIFFANNKATLRKESETELEKLYSFLRDNPGVKIEISGHTDSKGADAANVKLSQMRAQAVMNNLAKKGIDKFRLIALGYGKAQPIASNVRPDGKPDPEGMQLNRRVEMKIIQ